MGFTGWYENKSNDNWYYYKNDKALTNQWFKDTNDNNRWYYFNNDGSMKKGWLWSNGYWCYLAEKPSGDFKLGQAYQNITVTFSCGTYKFYNSCYGLLINSSNTSISDDLCKMISYFEGCKLKAYYCPSHILTIGIGCTNTKWTSKGTITLQQAYQAFREDIKVFEKGVDSLGLNLKSYEREALISFAFNCGIGALRNSTLLKLIRNRNGNITQITNAFLSWNKGNGKVLDGLTRRRQAEAKLFLTGKYTY